MEYFDIIREIFNETEIDGYIYEDGDNEGKEVLQMCSWKDVETLNRELKKKFEERGIDTSEMSLYQETSDDGYIEFATDDNWVFADESFVCDGCGKLHRMETYGYANYFCGDYGIFCANCVKEEPEPYLDYHINNYKTANTILTEKELNDAGFVDSGEEYASGWYNRDERPETVLKCILDTHPKAEVIFDVKKTYNPFETEYRAFVRYNEEE